MVNNWKLLTREGGVLALRADGGVLLGFLKSTLRGIWSPRKWYPTRENLDEIYSRAAYKTEKKKDKEFFRWFSKVILETILAFIFFLLTMYNEAKLDPVWGDWKVKKVKKVPWLGFIKPKKGTLTRGTSPYLLFA